MNKEFIINRLQEIEQSIQQTIAQHNSLQGAKSELMFLLKNIAVNVGEGIIEETLEKTNDVSIPEAPQV
jgi:hypothetical protein